ncbi:hyccin-like [Dysidea avara]|uniref:hyccin-like n=1 Tax=Dysidea avara TaxID=196820 RepID=UPI003328E2B6
MAGIKEILRQYEASQCTGSVKTSLLQNDHVPNTVVQCLNEQLDSGTYSDGILVVQWLCDLQKLNVTELSVFVLQFVPNIAILFAHSTTNEQFNTVVQTCLRNVLLLAEKSKVFEKPNMPHLGRPSVFHKPSSDVPQPLTVSALQKHDNVDSDCLQRSVNFEVINEENRLNFLNALVQTYVFYIISLSHLSQLQYCHFCTRLSSQGMHYTSSLQDTCRGSDCLSAPQLDKLASLRRHKMSSTLLCMLLHGLQRILLQYNSPSARQSLKAVDMRAKYELFPAVIQLSRSIRTLLENVHSSKVHYYFTDDDKQMPIDVSIAGIRLTDPRIPKDPLILSLLKYHSPSTSNEDDVDSSIFSSVTPNVTFTVKLDKEQQIKETDV